MTRSAVVSEARALLDELTGTTIEGYDAEDVRERYDSLASSDNLEADDLETESVVNSWLLENGYLIVGSYELNGNLTHYRIAENLFSAPPLPEAAVDIEGSYHDGSSPTVTVTVRDRTFEREFPNWIDPEDFTALADDVVESESIDREFVVDDEPDDLFFVYCVHPDDESLVRGRLIEARYSD